MAGHLHKWRFVRPKTLVLLVAVSAVAAQAQELDLSSFRPVRASAEVEVTRTPEVVAAPDAGPAVAEPVRVVKMPVIATPPVAESACTRTSDCETGFTCAPHRNLGGGRWSGLCQVPWLIEPADDTSADRFEYRGAVPKGFHLVSERRMALVGTGIGTFTAAYFALAGWAIVGNRFEPLILIPLAGPFILSGKLLGDGFERGLPLILVLGALAVTTVQAAGLFIFVAGLASPRRWLERHVAKPGVTFVPGAAGAPLGASVVGRF